MLLQYVTSATVMPRFMAACRSVWSEPMPAVTIIFSFGALAILSAVMYAGQNGCEMTISASASSFSSRLFGPSLSEVTTSLCPRDSRNLRRPSSPETLPSSAPGLKSIPCGVGNDWPPG